MTKKSSRAIPFVVLAIVIVTIVVEETQNTKIDLESYLPLLVPLGVAGAAKSAITRAATAKSEIDKLKLVDEIKTQLKKENLIKWLQKTPLCFLFYCH